jgi:phage terminase Nu1 subunit (DNA packaging protein)
MKSVTKKEFADLAGVSKAAISQMVKAGRIPVTSDGRIDVDLPECRDYLGKKGVTLPSPSPPHPSVDEKPSGRAAMFARRSRKKLSEKPTENKTGKTVSEVMTRRDMEFKKLAAQTQNLELKNAHAEGRLVSRDAMVRGVFNPLETFLVRLLTDGAKTLAAKVYPVGKSGGTIEEAEIEARLQLTTLVKPLRAKMRKSLKMESDV